MEEKKITLDTNDEGQQLAYALGNQIGYMKGARDTGKAVAATGLTIGLVTLVVVAKDDIVNGVKGVVSNFKEKRKLRKEKKRKAKEEKAK